LLGLSRSSYYYQTSGESDYNLLLMRLIDEQYTRTPFYGVPRLTQWLRHQGHRVNRKRVRRLMKLMGLEAIYPKPKMSRKGEVVTKYPYLLSDVIIRKPNQAWASDITYIRLQQGYVYLVAIMDWYSRYVLSWELSNSLDVFFCLSALERALSRATPEIFNSDQGSQFTSEAFTSRLQEAEVGISWDGRGRVFDNIFVERLWRSVKYEEVYLNDYDSIVMAEQGLRQYFNFYNRERYHQSLNYRTPEQVYFQ
jgi:putative transposase